MSFRILLIDDSSVVRSVLRKALQLTGLPVAEVYEAGDGAEGLEVIRRGGVDLAFADITMPVMDGQEMIETMSAEGLLEQVPVVVVSSTQSDPRVQALLDAGVSAFLPKPFTPEQIRETIEQVLGVDRHAV
ncbi:MAG: response regulator [bacterium]|nr:response regulator [bacterium]